MAKGTTIHLTPEQREQIRNVTGQEHEALMVEAVPSEAGSAFATRQTLQGKKLLKRRAPLKRKLALKKRAPLKAKRALKRRLAPTGKFVRGRP